MNISVWNVFRGSRTCLQFILLLLPVISSQAWNIQQKTCSSVAEHSTQFFVNNVLGKNSAICGTEAEPCRSVSYTLGQAIRQNISTVVLNISAGLYEEAAGIKLDCSHGSLRQITLWGSRRGDQVVRVDFSLDVLLCNTCLFDIHWINTRPFLINAFMSEVLLNRCTVSGTNVSVVGSSSNISLQDSEIHACKGFRLLLPLISASSISGYKSLLQITNTTFAHNTAQLMFIADVVQASIDSSKLEQNNAVGGGILLSAQFTRLAISRTVFLRNGGTLVGVEGAGSFNVSGCLFEGNTVYSGSGFLLGSHVTAAVEDCVFMETSSSLPGPVIRIKDKDASATFLRCNFSCNTVNSSAFASPVMSLNAAQVQCDNCSVDPRCPVHCFPGEFLSDSILCQPCSSGTFSRGTMLNKTVLQCQKCPAGSYSSKARSQTCTPCEQDMFSAKIGSTSCSKCTNDFFTSKPGQASCNRVTVGFIVLSLFVLLLIIIPSVILLHRIMGSSHKESCISNDELTQKLCADEKHCYSVQSQGVPGPSYL